MLWFYEVYYNDTYDEHAVLSVWRDEDGTEQYNVDFGCQMWNKIYKRHSSAVKLLEKCGYAKEETVISLSGKCPLVHNGRIIDRR